MSKPVLQLAALGVAGVVVWKLFSGVLLGVLFTVLKIVFLVALAFLAVWVFKRWSDKQEKKDDAPAE
jgi:membrane protein implicated in regulation of membrane protease activity